MSVLTDIAAICGSVTVILIFFAAVARVRWVRWTWGKLVSDPTGRWLKAVVTEGASEWHAVAVEPRLAAIEKQLTTNDGSTLRDEVVAGRSEARAARKEATDAARAAAEAAGYARQVAEYHGFPPGVDPTERTPSLK